MSFCTKLYSNCRKLFFYSKLSSGATATQARPLLAPEASADDSSEHCSLFHVRKLSYIFTYRITMSDAIQLPAPLLQRYDRM